MDEKAWALPLDVAQIFTGQSVGLVDWWIPTWVSWLAPALVCRWRKAATFTSSLATCSGRACDTSLSSATSSIQFLPTRVAVVEMTGCCLLSGLRIYSTWMRSITFWARTWRGGIWQAAVGSFLPLTCKRQNSTGMFHSGPLRVPTFVYTYHVFQVLWPADLTLRRQHVTNELRAHCS